MRASSIHSWLGELLQVGRHEEPAGRDRQGWGLRNPKLGSGQIREKDIGEYQTLTFSAQRLPPIDLRWQVIYLCRTITKRWSD